MPLGCFYKHPRMHDGHLNKCKECTKKDTINNREAKLEYYQEYDRKRASLPHCIEGRRIVSERWKKDPVLKKRINKLKREWIKKNTIKRAAHIITGNAIRDGRLIREVCEVCGNKKVDAHHDNYEKPLEIRWLCKKHHAAHHVKIRELERQK